MIINTNSNKIMKFNIFSEKVINTVILVNGGIALWTSFIGLMVLLSVNSFSLLWLFLLVLLIFAFAMACYHLGEDGFKKVTGINWIEKKFNIDLTEE